MTYSLIHRFVYPNVIASFHLVKEALKCLQSMVKVAIVGHSQVPQEIIIPGVETRVFRKPGARIHDFHRDLLPELLSFSADIIVIFLGGNDIDARPDCALRVAEGLKGVVEILKDSCREVIFIQIEWRDFSRTRVPGLTKEIYNQRRATINRNLKRYCSRHNIHAINTGLEDLERVRRDGVHFARESASVLKRKIIRAIRHAIGRLERH